MTGNIGGIFPDHSSFFKKDINGPSQGYTNSVWNTLPNENNASGEPNANELSASVSSEKNAGSKESKTASEPKYPNTDATIVINEIKRINNISYANQKRVKIEEKWYDFDSNGRVINIYESEPEVRSGYDKNAIICNIEYDKNGEPVSYYQYLNGGSVDGDGNRVCVQYDKNGQSTKYIIENDINELGQACHRLETLDPQGKFAIGVSYAYETDENGNVQKLTVSSDLPITMLEKVEAKNTPEGSEYEVSLYNGVKFKYKSASSISKENLQVTNFADISMKNIEGSDITIVVENKEFNIQKMTPDDFAELLDIVPADALNDMYKSITGHYLLVDLATNPKCGKELIEVFASYILDYAEGANAIADDIYQDMDINYKNCNWARLNIDCERLVARTKNTLILEECRQELHKVPLTSVNDISFDVPTQQGVAGTCYLISAIYASTTKNISNDILKSAVNVDNDNKTITVNLPGYGKSYTITFDELDKSDFYSNGDYTVRAFEIAFDKYRRDNAYEMAENGQIAQSVNVEGGKLSDFTEAMFGRGAEEDLSADMIDPQDYNDENTLYLFGVVDDDEDDLAMENEYYTATVNDANAKVLMPRSHAFSVLGYKRGMITFKDPQEDITRIILPQNFSKIASISRFKFGQN